MHGLLGSVEFWLCLAAAVVAYDAYVIGLVFRSTGYTGAQRLSQILLVLLLPLAGTAAVHWFAKHGTSVLPVRDREFEPREVDGA